MLSSRRMASGNTTTTTTTVAPTTTTTTTTTYAPGAPLVPIMTGPTTSGVTVSSTTALWMNSQAYAAWHAFDGSTNHWNPLDSVVPYNITIDFGLAKIARQLGFADQWPQYYPSSIDIQGSNNGSTFTQIARIIPSGQSTVMTIYPFTNNTAYRFYKILINTASGHEVAINEMQLYS
jgi:hypothetical protein